jgi:hypothetical protein
MEPPHMAVRNIRFSFVPRNQSLKNQKSQPLFFVVIRVRLHPDHVGGGEILPNPTLKKGRCLLVLCQT